MFCATRPRTKLKVGPGPPCESAIQDMESGRGNNSLDVELPRVVTAIRHLAWISGVLAVGMATAAAAEESHVKASLVADAAELRAGESFHLGVLLEPEPGWHVYWRNPGEAGLATEVRLFSAGGFEIGELGWPIPVAFTQPGDLAGYGYEDPVVLAAEVTAPETTIAATPVTVNASWLACKDVCVLGSAELKAELPLEGAELAASRAAFETWSETLPIALEPGLFDLSVTGGPVPDSGSVTLAVWLNWKAAPGAVEFFPDPGAGLKVEDVRVQTRGQLTRIDFSVSRLKTSSARSATLRSLIVTKDGTGRRSARVAHIDLD